MAHELSDHVLRLYKDCEECDGTGTSAFGVPEGCITCGGKGEIIAKVRFGDLLTEIEKVAVQTARTYGNRSGAPD